MFEQASKVRHPIVGVDQLRVWRVAAKQAVDAYDAWCSASWRDREMRYMLFLDALDHEERTARVVACTSNLGDAGKRLDGEDLHRLGA